MTTTFVPGDVELDLAFETLYRFLSAAMSDPRSGRWQLALDPTCQELASEAADLLREACADQLIPLGFGEAPTDELDLRPAVTILNRRRIDVCNDYLHIFGLVHCRECPPYETEYHPNEDTFFRSQQMADVAGFYRAFGLRSDPHERPDQICLELEFAAFLLLKKREAEAASQSEQAAICASAMQAFFTDHMSWWMPSFALALRTKAGDGFYEAMGRALASILPLQRQRFGIAAPRVPLQANVNEEPEECAGCAAACGA